MAEIILLCPLTTSPLLILGDHWIAILPAFLNSFIIKM